MKRWSMIGTVAQLTLIACLISAAVVSAASDLNAGGRPVLASEASRSSLGPVPAAPSSFQEITASFTAPTGIATLGDTIAASRSTFSATEPIEFDAILNDTGLSGGAAKLQLFVFDPKGRLVFNSPVLNVNPPLQDHQDFFTTLDAGALAVGQYHWAILIFDHFNNAFVTPFQALQVVSGGSPGM